ncbi:hypothetical protein LA66_13995 [Aureimonas altamirensis]|uniref:YfbU family protein n=1 Tax=Aureimonas altamirensis TaxID=370622 RepID=A0A0B1Q174_9HYPH|nr:YfbU family protein [Aureimonas altamirensis]KHJ54538.1 hypothetical protein LA66_13995 [Aureimonas altamirensis]
MPKLNFTPEQRFIIAMLCDLYKDPGNRELNPSFIQDAVFNGHDWALDWQYGGILPGRVDTDEQVRFVVDVLDMWRFIERSWRALPAPEQQRVHQQVPHLGTGPEFIGFDGNNETEYMSIARMFVIGMERFTEFTGRSLNSHSPKVDRYRGMLRDFLPMRDNLHTGDLSADQLITLLTR